MGDIGSTGIVKEIIEHPRYDTTAPLSGQPKSAKETWTLGELDVVGFRARAIPATGEGLLALAA